MNVRSSILMGCLIGALGAFGTLVSADAGDGSVEILTHGPVHEAFAEVVNFDPQPGLIVRVEPPPLIEELPPEQQLSGDNIVWIPGYWAWDPDQESFLWISGVWRAMPPGREWVPGYWNDLGGSFQWVSGYWADTQVEQVVYLPTPPQTIEVGPSIAAPSSDHYWIPGTWLWHDTRYVWSPGYWTPLREQWTYVPSRYVWTPRGHVYVGGYWDYAVVRRGVLFAPVYFHTPVYRNVGYFYRPNTVISLTFFTNHLFLRPNYGHYYFGDYYAPRYRNVGLVPVFEYHSRRGCYDPIFAYNRWEHRNDRGWETRYRRDYDLRRDNERARPPRTWAALQERREDRDWGRNQVAAPLGDYAKRQGQRFQRIDREREQRLVRQRQEVTRYRQERERAEVHAERGRNNPSQPVVRDRARSPLASRAPVPEGLPRREGRAAIPEVNQPGRTPRPREGRAETPAPNERSGRDGAGRPAPDTSERPSPGTAPRGPRNPERETPHSSRPQPQARPERQVTPRPQPQPRQQPQVTPRQPQSQRQPAAPRGEGRGRGERGDR
jgi:hypothetical protein